MPGESLQTLRKKDPIIMHSRPLVFVQKQSLTNKKPFPYRILPLELQAITWFIRAHLQNKGKTCPADIIQACFHIYQHNFGISSTVPASFF